MIPLILYTTVGCHLCEQAEALLAAQARRGAGIELEACDIADDEALMERYGIRIPVVRRRDTGEELGWPFDEEQLSRFLMPDRSRSSA